MLAGRNQGVPRFGVKGARPNMQRCPNYLNVHGQANPFSLPEARHAWQPLQKPRQWCQSKNCCQYGQHSCAYMGGCQNYDPFLGTQNTRCRIMIGIQKGTIILTTTHMPALACIRATRLQLVESHQRMVPGNQRNCLSNGIHEKNA